MVAYKYATVEGLSLHVRVLQQMVLHGKAFVHCYKINLPSSCSCILLVPTLICTQRVCTGSYQLVVTHDCTFIVAVRNGLTKVEGVCPPHSKSGGPCGGDQVCVCVRAHVRAPVLMAIPVYNWNTIYYSHVSRSITTIVQYACTVDSPCLIGLAQTSSICNQPIISIVT